MPKERRTRRSRRGWLVFSLVLAFLAGCAFATYIGVYRERNALRREREVLMLIRGVRQREASELRAHIAARDAAIHMVSRMQNGEGDPDLLLAQFREIMRLNKLKLDHVRITEVQLDTLYQGGCLSRAHRVYNSVESALADTSEPFTIDAHRAVAHIRDMLRKSKIRPEQSVLSEPYLAQLLERAELRRLRDMGEEERRREPPSWRAIGPRVTHDPRGRSL